MSIVQQLIAQGLAEPVAGATLDPFLAGEGLRVLLFAGRGRSEADDVAVALRELLRTWPGAARAGIVTEADERAAMARFRVAVLPSLVLVSGGEALEVLPRVRDWADYEDAFRRYLGAPPGARAAEAVCEAVHAGRERIDRDGKPRQVLGASPQDTGEARP